jgi:hypothetical protein
MMSPRHSTEALSQFAWSLWEIAVVVFALVALVAAFGPIIFIIWGALAVPAFVVLMACFGLGRGRGA